jgi:AraC family transcriptional regulator
MCSGKRLRDNGARDCQGADFVGKSAMNHSVLFAPADAVSRRIASWGNATGEIVEANRRGRIEGRFRAPVHMLAVYERGVRQDGGTYVEGLAQSALQDCRRKMVFVPAGCEYYEWQEPCTLPRVSYLYLHPGRLAPHLSGILLSPRLFFEDSALWDTALKLITLIEGGGPDNGRYAEAPCVVLAHELVRLNVGGRHAGTRVQGGLAAWRRQRVAVYIEEHLAGPIPPATLAQIVHLSPAYFCRAFRQSFGMPPQRYQIAQRRRRLRYEGSVRTTELMSVPSQPKKRNRPALQGAAAD